MKLITKSSFDGKARVENWSEAGSQSYTAKLQEAIKPQDWMSCTVSVKKKSALQVSFPCAAEADLLLKYKQNILFIFTFFVS